ncbi:MAG TPA: 2-octaprenyl-6-methoxyphenyl hydroxylase [Leucothrix mucor]|nr:2-octaprenyl-6-methoxyphenyl hydroxylase [Leucothrix mucor]
MKDKKTNQSPPCYDIIIVGGGMVGASLAIALKPLKLNVALVDAFPPRDSKHPAYDDRAIALSYGSSLIYQGMGIWSSIKVDVTSIQNIHVSDRGHFGATRLSATKEKVDALGYLVEARLLGKQLYKELNNDAAIEHIIPARVEALKYHDDYLEVSLNKDGETQTLHCQLLVASDGTNSTIRTLSGIGTQRSDYHQVGIIANVSTEKPHQNQAFERFTADGPIALLPMSDNRCSLIWTKPTDKADDILALDDKAFLQKLGEDFGYRLGRFTKVGKRSSFPFALLRSDRNTAERVVLIGNASHTMHPVAGQGLNLALRDVAVLADLLAKQSPLNTKQLLLDYEEKREPDINTTIRYTDSLVKLFSNDLFLLGHARAAGLLAVDRISPLRNWLTAQSMGTKYRQARLSRGLPLSNTLSSHTGHAKQ